jgi:hypothetical protein
VHGTDLCLGYYCCNSAWNSELEAPSQYCLTNRWIYYYCNTVEDGKARQRRQNDKPEPQENKDLLIQDVEGQDTQRIVRLNTSCKSHYIIIFMQITWWKGEWR